MRCFQPVQGIPKPLSELDLKPWSYYVVYVSQRDGNPWHKAILSTGAGGASYASLFNGSYEEHPDHAIDRRALFIVISQITDMEE